VNKREVVAEAIQLYIRWISSITGGREGGESKTEIAGQLAVCVGALLVVISTT